MNCILNLTPENIKSNMASASIILGLTPPILSMASSTLSETSLLATRRPFLSFLLTVGAPFISPIRAFDYPDPVAALVQPVAPMKLAKLSSPMKSTLVVILEYTFAMAAVVNILTTLWQLSIQTGSAFASDVDWTIMLIEPLLIGIYILNTAAFHLRIRVEAPGAHGQTPLSIRQKLLRITQAELTLCGNQAALVLRWRQETFWFIAASWLTSFATVFHALYSILVFSSPLFISNRDASIVIARLWASAIVCRFVLMFEIAGLRAVARVTEGVSTESAGQVVKSG